MNAPINLSPAKGELPQSDASRPMRIGLLVLVLGLGGFLVWAAYAPLDEGVPTSATVVVDTKRKPVQHLTGGILSEVLVREGQAVKAGEVVARLNSATSRANYEAVRQHYMGLSAMESRIVAEQQGAQSITFPAEVLDTPDPMVQQQVETQRQLFESRRRALAAELEGIRAAIAGNRSMIAGYRGQLASREQQLSLLSEELAGVVRLVAEGYAPRARELELQRAAAALKGEILELQGNIARTERDIAELEARAEQRQQEYRKEGDEQLAQIRLELQAQREKFKAVAEELERVDLRAPVDGQVVALEVQSVGAVVQPAQKIMDIVPFDEPLMLEAQLPPQVIDRVAPGQAVDVRFSAFAHSPALVVEGRLESISRDLVYTDTPNGRFSYYLGRVSITPAGKQVLGDREMHPGMPAEAIIKTGERSLLTYLLHPLTKRVASAMKEE